MRTKPPVNSGGGLATALAFIGGGATGFYLMSHPLAQAHTIMARVAAYAGHTSTPLGRAGSGALVAAIPLVILGCWLDGKIQVSLRRAAIRRAAEESMWAERERARLAGKIEQTPRSMIAAMRREGSGNHATPGFVAALLAGAVVILFAADYCITHF